MSSPRPRTCFTISKSASAVVSFSLKVEVCTKARDEHHIGMIVPNIVDAISRKEVDDPAPLCGKQLRSHAPLVADIHLQQLEKPHPLRVYVLLVFAQSADWLSSFNCCSHHFPIETTASSPWRSAWRTPNKWQPKSGFHCWLSGCRTELPKPTPQRNTSRSNLSAEN